MRKNIILMALLLLVFSITVNAKNIAEFNYSSFKGASLLDFTLTADLTNNIVVKGTYSIADTIIGDANKFDIQGGFRSERYGTWLAGIRKSGNNTGFLLTTNLRGPAFGEDVPFFMDMTMESISWFDSDIYALSDKIFIGYNINENVAIKGGLTWILSQGESEFGPTFGLETSF